MQWGDSYPSLVNPPAAKLNAMHDDFSSLPIIDIAALAVNIADKQHVTAQIDTACRHSGFFYVVGQARHLGVDSVPFFVVNEAVTISGAQSSEILLAASAQATDGRSES